MTCKYCGAEVPENADFCPKCGGIVDNGGDNKKKGSPKEIKPIEKNRRGSLTGLITALVIVAALLLACVAAALLDYFDIVDVPFIELGQAAGSDTGERPGARSKQPSIKLDPNNERHCLVTVFAKAGTTLIYETSDGSRKEAEVPKESYVKFSVAFSSLIPQEPLETETVSVVPKVYTVNDDGTETLIEGFEPIEIDVPKMEVSFDNEGEIVSNDGTAVISGRVTPADAEIRFDGVTAEVGHDGSFSRVLAYPESGEYTAEFEARRPGYRVERRSFRVRVEVPETGVIQFPWEYGDLSFTQRVKNDADIPLEVWGRVPAGATVTASCANEAVIITEPSVDANGKFSFVVTMPAAGDYEISIRCSFSSGESVERVLHVQRAPEWRAYVEGSWAMSYEALCFASRQAYKLSGTVVEVVEDGDVLTVLLDIGDGKTVMLKYHNHYPNAGSLEVGSEHTGIYGHPLGKNDDGTPVVYVWFVID